jgi:orotate phosphoribosyltransferase
MNDARTPASEPTHRDELRDLLLRRSLFQGDFTLASGVRSTYYVDARRTTMSAQGQFLVGEVALRAMEKAGWVPEWVGGLTMGADPIAYAVAHRSWLEGRPIQAFSIRKKAKEHGTGRRIEGGLPEGAPVVVVEDAMTSGASALEAIRALEDHGARILGLLTVVDREEGGRERIREAGYEVVALFTARELLDAAPA